MKGVHPRDSAVIAERMCIRIGQALVRAGVRSSKGRTEQHCGVRIRMEVFGDKGVKWPAGKTTAASGGSGKDGRDFAYCADCTDVRSGLSRYWLIRVFIAAVALAVRHGGLNGYKGQ